MRFYFPPVYSTSLTARSFQDLEEHLRSLLSIGVPSSNLTKTCNRSCRYTSMRSLLRVMLQLFRLKRPFLRKSCALIGNMVLVDGLCAFCPWVRRFVFPIYLFAYEDDLDGGGVRGISSLHVLKAIMGKITGDPNAKPCDYFDMMAGTSTGGYAPPTSCK